MNKRTLRRLFATTALALVGTFSTYANANCSIDPRCASNQAPRTSNTYAPSTQSSASTTYQGTTQSVTQAAMTGAAYSAILNMQRVRPGNPPSATLGNSTRILGAIGDILDGVSGRNPITGDTIEIFGGDREARDRVREARREGIRIGSIIDGARQAGHSARSARTDAYNDGLSRAQREVRSESQRLFTLTNQRVLSLHRSGVLRTRAVQNHSLSDVVKIGTTRGGQRVYITPYGEVYGSAQQARLDAQMRQAATQTQNALAQQLATGSQGAGNGTMARYVANLLGFGRYDRYIPR